MSDFVFIGISVDEIGGGWDDWMGARLLDSCFIALVFGIILFSVNYRQLSTIGCPKLLLYV